MVTSRPAVMSQAYQRFCARGGFFSPVPPPGRMTCSGVRAAPAGTVTSKTAPVSAIRLEPFFSPVPAPLLESLDPLLRGLGAAAARLREHRHALAVRRDRQRRPGLLPLPLPARPPG